MMGGKIDAFMIELLFYQSCFILCVMSSGKPVGGVTILFNAYDIGLHNFLFFPQRQ